MKICTRPNWGVFMWCIGGQRKYTEDRTHPRWCIFVFGVEKDERRQIRKHTVHTNESVCSCLVCIRVQHELEGKEICRRRKHTNKGEFPSYRICAKHDI